MKLTIRSMLMAVAASLLVSQGVLRADDKDTDEGTVTLKSTIAKDSVPSCLGACRVNFMKEYGLSLGYLDSIGHSIHQARLAPDPVQLALCAKGLEAAEQVSGKKATVTAEQVLSEAIELAKLRGISEELTALAALVDPATQEDLTAQAEVARDAEADAREATKAGEQDKELIGNLTVANYSHECVKIYMDGRYLGVVHEGQTNRFHVHNHNWHNHFDAYCLEDGELVQHGDYEGHSHSLRWEIR